MIAITIRSGLICATDTDWYLKLKAEGAPIEMQNGVVICLAQITQREESGEIIYTWES